MQDMPLVHRGQPRATQHVSLVWSSKTISTWPWRKQTLICNGRNNAQRTNLPRSFLLPNTHPLRPIYMKRGPQPATMSHTQHVRRMWCNKNNIVKPWSKAEVVRQVPNYCTKDVSTSAMHTTEHSRPESMQNKGHWSTTDDQEKRSMSAM